MIKQRDESEAVFAREHQQEIEKIEQLRQNALTQLGDFTPDPRDEEFEYEAEYQARLKHELLEYTQHKQAIMDLWQETATQALARLEDRKQQTLTDLSAEILYLLAQRYLLLSADLTNFKYQLLAGELHCQAALSVLGITHTVTATVPMPREVAKLYRHQADRFCLAVTLAFTEQPNLQIAGAELRILGEGHYPATVTAFDFAELGKRQILAPIAIHGWSRAQVQERQAKTAMCLQLPVVFHDLLKDGNPGPSLVVIPSGIFQMGSPATEKDRRADENLHAVTIETPFAVGIYAVTFAEYDLYCQATGLPKPKDEGWGRGNQPVINVNWQEANTYCQWLSLETRQTYRLLTEAEWEYAARAGSTTASWWGDTIDLHKANYNLNSGNTLAVDQFEPNPWGLYQVHGNVWDWCSSLYDAYDNLKELLPADEKDSGRRSMRGGSWNDIARGLRSANRSRAACSNANYFRGFRICRSLC